ncbi:MAG TPA: hypothetical protein VG675_14755 [Bryobacteraceae bacterium]|nr:hypothetical protein [Bryobacteraceae bacterium]
MFGLKWRSMLKEFAYIAGASMLMLALYRVVVPWLSRPPDYRYIAEVKRRIARYPVIAPGKYLMARKANLSKHPFALFLMVSPDCVFCVRSEPFYRRLLSEARNQAFPVFISLPKVSQAGGYMSDSGIERAQFLDWEDLSRRVQATPSIVFVDSGGVIRRVWIGQLGETAEHEVINAIDNPWNVHLPVRSLASGVQMLKLRDLKSMRSAVSVRLINIAERSSFKTEHIEGAVNIPFGELAARAVFELKRSDLNIVDCTAELDDRCSAAVETLKDLGFRAAALDASR